MNLVARAQEKIRKIWSKNRHDYAISDVLKTGRIYSEKSDVTFLSMMCHRDVLMYIVSLKSIYSKVGRGMVVIVDDGSLTAEDKDILDRHVADITYIDMAGIETAPCPRGGAWERLLTVLDLSRDSYVIQVDADLVALGPMREVVDSVKANRAFTLSGGKGDDVLLTVAEASRNARGSTSRHIQTLTEQTLDQCEELAGRHYARGCAGFAGFPRNDGGRALATLFSQAMEKRIGGRWSEWGSEQACSNFVIANFPDPLILPWPKYMSFEAGDDPNGADLLHFYGTFRYAGGHYTRMSRKVISTFPRDAAKASPS